MAGSVSATTLATIAAVSAVAAAGTSAYSMYASAENQKEVADYNAKIQRYKAQDALQRGAIEGAAKRDKARKIASKQAEAFSMSNVALDTGTPLALLTETAGLGELDALRSVNNAQREAWGYQAQANLDEAQGNAAMGTAAFNIAGTFLNSASSAAKSYYGYKKDGTF